MLLAARMAPPSARPLDVMSIWLSWNASPSTLTSALPPSSIKRPAPVRVRTVVMPLLALMRSVVSMASASPVSVTTTGGGSAGSNRMRSPLPALSTASRSVQVASQVPSPASPVSVTTQSVPKALPPMLASMSSTICRVGVGMRLMSICLGLPEERKRCSGWRRWCFEAIRKDHRRELNRPEIADRCGVIGHRAGCDQLIEDDGFRAQCIQAIG